MRERFANLAKQTLIYGAGAAAVQAVGVVTLPVYSRVFSPAEYGVLEIATVGFSIMMTVAEMGMASASQRSFFDYEDEGARRRVLVTAVSTATLAAAILSLTVFLLRDPVSTWLYGTDEHSTIIAIVALTVPVANFAVLTREIMRLRFRAGHYATSSFTGAAAGATYGVTAVVALDQGLEGVVTGILLGHVIAIAYGGIVIRGDLRGRFYPRELRIMLRYGLPLIPAALALWALSFIDRIMLAKLSTLDEVGQYAVANRVAGLLMLGVTAVSIAVGPFLLEIYSRDRQEELRVRARLLTAVAAGFGLIGLSLALFAREIITIVAPDFDEAFRATGLVIAGVVFYAVSSVVVTGISYVRKTSLVAIAAAAAAATNIGFNLVLIPPLGQIGAAVATAVAYGSMVVLYYWKAQQLYPTPFEPRKVVTAIALAVALGAVGVASIEPLPLALGLKLACVGVYIAGLLGLRVISRSELLSLRALVGGALPARAGA